jgi:hypothetical protein
VRCARHARARECNRRWRVRRVARDAHASAYYSRRRRSELSCHRHGLIRRQDFAGSDAAGAESCSRRAHA